MVHGVSLDVPEGAIVTMLGANGAGKSTILRTISGLHAPDGGSITFEGNPIGGRSPREVVLRGIAHVPEGRRIFPDLTVAENLEMGAYTIPDRAERTAEVLELLPLLRDFLDRPGGGLSGGQQQLLAIGRGLMSRPRMLLLDEPSLGLSPAAVRTVADVVGHVRSLGTSILIVEQNASLAFDLADVGYVLAEGRVVLSGPTSELRDDASIREAYLGI